MAKLSAIPDNPQAESKYRQGYTHGVEAALLAVDHHLSEGDKAKIAKWKNQLLAWRSDKAHSRFEAPNPPSLEVDTNQTQRPEPPR